MPRIIDEQALATLGHVFAETPGGKGHVAFPVSSGEAVGPARVLSSPLQADDLGRGYILVCPSTDPSWTPLFANAAGLVLERGGTLSHGAIVARELGLPAVVLPDATQRFHEGDDLHVNGSSGWVGFVSETALPEVSAQAVNPDDVRISPELVPPLPGKKDRRAAMLGSLFAVLWAAYLLACFGLPEPRVYQPTLAVLDFLLWPMVRGWGKPATVALSQRAWLRWC